MNRINFEQDKQDVVEKTSNIDKLANKIKEMQSIQKDIEVNVSLQFIDGELVGTSNFVLLCSDFGIKIPKIVSDKLANEIQVTVKAALTKI